MDDDHVEIGLLIPAAAGPGAEEDDGLRVGLGRQVRQRLIAAGSGSGWITAGISLPMRCRLTGGTGWSPAGRRARGNGLGGGRRWWSWADLRKAGEGGDFGG